MTPIVIAIIIVGILALVAIVLSLISLTTNKSGEKHIIVDDKDFKSRNGVLYARGFSNEPFKTTQQATIVGDNSIAAETLTDGSSVMTGGNLKVKHMVEARRLTDGKIVMENGDLTTSGCLSADRIVVNRGFSTPAEYFAHVFILAMNPIEFDAIHEWKTIGCTTKKLQLFFSGDDKLDHGVSLHPENKLQLHKEGKWKYSFTWIIHTDDPNAIIGAAFGHKQPQFAVGYGVSSTNNKCIVSGTGIVQVNDVDDRFQFWLNHNEVVEQHQIQLLHGHTTITYIGR